MAAGLAWAIHSIPHRHVTAHADHAALPKEERDRRWRDVALLFAANAIRFTVNMMLIQLIIRWSERWALDQASAESLTHELRMRATEINGPLQAAMSIGMGIAAILVGWLMRPHLEKPTLLAVPILGAVAIAAYPHATSLWSAFSLAVVGGIGYAGVMPITITMAQRLLPHRTSLASALMLGGAWTIAASGPPIAQWLYARVDLKEAFVWVAGLLLVSVALTIPLRRSPRG
jgi:MFS family permease